MEAEIKREKGKIDELFQLAINVDDVEVQSHLSKYLCILVAGFLENSLKIMIEEYISINDTHPNINKFVKEKIKNITNLNSKKIGDLLASFSEDWKTSYKETVEEEEKDAISSVYTNRNNIAHGNDVDISINRMEGYYTQIWNAIQKIHSNCIFC